MAKQLSVKLTNQDEKLLKGVKDRFGVTKDSEAIRLALKMAVHLEVPARI